MCVCVCVCGSCQCESSILVGGESCHSDLALSSQRKKIMHISLSLLVYECLCTSREPRPSPGSLHLLPCVGQHVVALGLIDQITTRLRGLDQLLVVHHVQQVGWVDEGKTHHRQQL